jgi:hypothetical protein
LAGIVPSAVSACGARSGLGEGAPQAESCAVDADCTDLVACTTDLCDAILHVCSHVPQHEACNDGAFCSGDESCDVEVGCVTRPRDCADAAACTEDTCDEVGRQCLHRPDDAACPAGHVCDAKLDCEPQAFVHDASTLYEVRILSGRVNAVGNTSETFTDIAPGPNDVFYGLGDGALHTVNAAGGQSVNQVSLAPVNLNAADVDPISGKLYASGSAALYAVDPQNGVATFMMALPSGWSSSGDLAFLDGRLVGSAVKVEVDSLIEFDLELNTARIVGPIGQRCVWGLAAYGQKLYGFTCDGRILSIDGATGAGTELHHLGQAFRGASTPPRL